MALLGLGRQSVALGVTDTVTEPPTLIAPVSNTTIGGTSTVISFTLPEAAAITGSRPYSPGGVSSAKVTFDNGTNQYVLTGNAYVVSGTIQLSVNLRQPAIGTFGPAGFATGPAIPQGGPYSVFVSYSDQYFNPTASSAAATGVMVDLATDSLAINSVAADASDPKLLSVSYTLPEDAASGTLKLYIIGTGGSLLVLSDSMGTAGTHVLTFDPGDPLSCPGIVTGTAVKSGTYSFRLEYQDTLLNPAYGDYYSPQTSIDSETLVPSITSPGTAPCQLPLQVTYFLPEGALRGSVKLHFGDQEWTLSPSFESPGAHTVYLGPQNPTGIPNFITTDPIASGQYSLSVSYQDNLGHPAAVANRAPVEIDMETQTPVLRSPGNDSSFPGSVSVNFNLPEAPAAGSVILRFGEHPLVLAYTLESAGDHTFTLDPANPLASPAVVSGDPVPDGTYDVSVEYRDTVGNPVASAVASHVVIDGATLAPVLSSPASASANRNPINVHFTLPEAALPGSLSLSIGSTVLQLGSALEGAGEHSFSFDPSSPTDSPAIATGLAIADGTYSVVLSYRDALGHTAAMATATGVRIDTVAPQLTLPNNIDSEATSKDGVVVTFDVTASDSADGSLSPVVDHPSGTVFPIGNTVVHVSATDAAGNETTGSFEVNVAGGDFDKNRPVITITQPTGSRVDGKFTIAGTVRDNFAVRSLTVKLNGTAQTLASPIDAQPGKPATWTVTEAEPENGDNVILVEAEDFSGQRAQATKRVTLAKDRPELEGNFTALLSPAGTPSLNTVGLITISVAKFGRFTGVAQLAGTRIPVRGILGNNGAARFVPALDSTLPLVKPGRLAADLGSLAFSIDGTSGMSGSLFTDANRTATLSSFAGAKASFSPRIPVNQDLIATYNVALGAATQTPPRDASTYPQGDGILTVRVSKFGAVTATGFLADGTVYSAGGSLRRDGSIPLFRPLYQMSGILAGNLSFTATTDLDVAGADFVWIRPAQPRAAMYPDGWPNGVTLSVTGTKYLAPPDFGQGTADPVAGNAHLKFADDLSGANAISVDVSVDPATGAVKVIRANSSACRLHLVSRSGLFSGSYTSPNTRQSYRGILLKKGATQIGQGYFLSLPPSSPSEARISGNVRLAPKQ